MMASDKAVYVREGVNLAVRCLTERFGELGFSHGKKFVWYQEYAEWANFISIDRVSGGRPAISAEVWFNVYFGLRIYNDPQQGLALNGPRLTPEFLSKGRYHHRFNAKSGSMFDRCISDIVRVVLDVGKAWFDEHQTVEQILASTWLTPEVKTSLRSFLQDKKDTEAVVLSYKVLGMKRRRE